MAHSSSATIHAPAPTSVAGKWTYRSYRNDPALVGDDPAKALALIFGEGVFSLTVKEESVSGIFDMGGGYVLDMSGTTHHVGPDGLTALDMVGKGRSGTPTDGWQYDYRSFLAPFWPKGVDQVAAFVGTVLRALPHNGQPAGVTASFIMVSQSVA